jgi:dTDP-4-amino-4,6-dideoxygalactose transaminase
MYGQAARLDKIIAFAQAHNIPVIEDACQAIGTRFKGKHVGSWGTVGCFSFHATKLVGAPGDGGMVITNTKDLAQKIKSLSTPQWGLETHHNQPRVPSRLAPLLVPVLNAKLKHLEDQIKIRRAQYELYKKAFTGINSIQLLEPSPSSQPSYRNTIIISRYRDKIGSVLAQNRIPVQPIYPNSKMLLTALDINAEAIPHTCNLINNNLALPMGSTFSKDKISHIARLITGAVDS